ncbi:MAG: insulinase family protein [Firmicutes bacterium]|nr:insulinase family protein [Bacillota bacterium]
MQQTKIPTKETLYCKELSNGLTCFILPKKGFLRTYGVLSTNYGSLDSRFQVPGAEIVDVPAGIAHFLEHKLFEEEHGNVFGRFAQWGASVNAFTSYTQTSYLFSTTENWQDCLTLLMEFVHSPYLTEENVEKEKGIIVQELQMYADHPGHRIYTLLLENMYHEHPIRLDIGGTVESVMNTTVEDLLRCYHTFYQPGNMALAIVGDVDPVESLSLIEEKYPSWDKEQVQIERLYPSEPADVRNAWVEETLQISQPRYLLGFKHEPVWQGVDLLRQQIIMSLGMRLIAGRSSTSYGELYEADLITDSFGASFNADPRYAYSVIGSETRDPEALHAKLTTIIDGLKKNQVAETDVERLKRHIYGSHLASYESFEYTANRFISHHFRGTPYHNYLDLLASVTAADVQQALIEQLNWDRSTITILRPVDIHD